MYKIICVAHIAIIIGIAMDSVGEMPVSNGLFDWTLPLTLFFLMATSALLGYMAGKNDQTEVNDESRAEGHSRLNDGLGTEPDYKLIAAKYYELLYEVAKKFPGETRHETALRYIRSVESAPSNGSPGVGNSVCRLLYFKILSLF